jgi:riboflavin kinase/FMN adenylyltransferase
VKPGIVTIGVFDGVHLGHQLLVRQVVERAQALGLRSLAVTFHPHPEQVLFPERKLTYLTGPQEREAILYDLGCDDVWTCPFTPELARLEPDEFMRVVTERQPLAELWVGSDFALGRGRRGSLSVLSEIGAAVGWALHVVPPQRYQGQIVSSTAIRTLLAAGAVRGAGDLLGRTYSVVGELTASGEACVDPLRALPRQGVFYDAQIRQGPLVEDVQLEVLPTPGHLQFKPSSDFHLGPLTIDFLRRGD